MPIQETAYDSTHDFMWAGSANHVGTEKFDGGDEIQDEIQSVSDTFTGDVPRGTDLCKTGISTKKTCQKVVENNYVGVDKSGTTVGPAVLLSHPTKNIAQCGDSGGPVYVGSVAYGIISRGDADGQCKGGKAMIYAPLKYFTGMNATIITAKPKPPTQIN